MINEDEKSGLDWIGGLKKLDWIGLEDWKSGRVENKQMDIARNRLGESGRLWNLGSLGSLGCWES